MNSSKPYKRVDRINSLILSLITEIQISNVDLSECGLITFTKIDVAPDLKTAKVYYSVIGSNKSKYDIDIYINKKRKAFKKFLGPKLNLRYTPDLKFYLDESLIKSQEISKIINNANKYDN